MRAVHRLTVMALIVLTLLPSTSFGWSAGGHRIVARIAWARLTERERQTIAELIRANPRFSRDFRVLANLVPRSEQSEIEWLFTQAAVWPDMIRSRPEFHRSTWHYINLPIYLTDDDRDALEEELPANLLTDVPENPEGARLNAIQCVKLCMDKLRDEEVEDEEKGVYICWLFHVVGDLHQPLHSSAMFSRVAFPSGDRGGNLIRTNSGNLHSFWDGLLGRNISINDVRSRAVELLRNDEMTALGEAALEDLNPEVWAEEGTELCRASVYTDAIRAAILRREDGSRSVIESVNLSNQYKSAAGVVARKRVTEAGYRLASLLKQVAAAHSGSGAPTSSGLRITGLLPDPAGLDRNAEQIRLMNTTTDAISLAGWKVRDDDGDALFLNGSIAAGAVREIVDADNDIPLSNRGEVVELINPAGDIIHRVAYERSDVERGEFIEFE